MKVDRSRSHKPYFATYNSVEAGTGPLVAALRARVSRRINGSVLAVMDETGARLSCSEKDRSAQGFWREIMGDLEAFLATTPELVRSFGTAKNAIAQVQWLTGRKANYWHQDVRWRTHWDVVLFLYVGTDPTPTDLACPDRQPTVTDPKDYVKLPQGQPDIAQWTSSGDLTLFRPSVQTGDLVVIDNRKVWHRTSPVLDDVTYPQTDDDALMTIRLKFFFHETRRDESSDVRGPPS